MHRITNVPIQPPRGGSLRSKQNFKVNNLLAYHTITKKYSRSTTAKYFSTKCIYVPVSIFSNSPNARMMLTISLAMILSQMIAMTKAEGTSTSCRSQWGGRWGRSSTKSSTDGMAAGMVVRGRSVCDGRVNICMFHPIVDLYFNLPQFSVMLIHCVSPKSYPIYWSNVCSYRAIVNLQYA